jgi:hypothetical protein
MAAAALCAFWTARTPRRGVFLTALIWLAVYGAFFSTWEPETECYRLFDFVPIGLLLAAAYAHVKNPAIFRSVAAFLALSLLAVNLSTRALPMTETRNNAIFHEFSGLAKGTPQNSVYWTAGGRRWIYILYFSGRQGFNVAPLRKRPDRLAALLADRLKRGPVYWHEDVDALELGLPVPLQKISRPLAGIDGWYEVKLP